MFRGEFELLPHCVQELGVVNGGIWINLTHLQLHYSLKDSSEGVLRQFEVVHLQYCLEFRQLHSTRVGRVVEIQLLSQFNLFQEDLTQETVVHELLVGNRSSVFGV